MRHIAVASLAAGAAMAQSIADLPMCGQICINNMIAQGPSLGCPLVNGQEDPKCFCDKPDFNFGVRDCAAEACQPEDIAPVINFGSAFCANAAAVPLEPGPVIPTFIPVATPIGPSETLVKTALVSTFTSGSLTMTTTLPKTLIVGTSGTAGFETTREAVDSTLTKTASTVRGAASDVRTSTTTSSSAKSTSASGAAGVPLLTVAVDGLFVGAAGVIAMLAM